jgi:hypothetical protein
MKPHLHHCVQSDLTQFVLFHRSMSSSNTRKNRKEEDWIQVHHILKDRQRQGKESVVYEWAQPADSKARKAISRLRLTWAERQTLDKSKLSITPFKLENVNSL